MPFGIITQARSILDSSYVVVVGPMVDGSVVEGVLPDTDMGCLDSDPDAGCPDSDPDVEEIYKILRK